MRKLLFLLFMTLPGVSFSADKIKPGKWIEVSRSTPDHKVVPFTDTIHIEFLIGNEYTWQKKNAFMFRGTYTIAGNSLDMGSRVFTIVKKQADRLVLQDESGIYELMPDHTVAARIANVDNAEHYNTVTNISQMIGHWSVFKSTNAAAKPSAIDYSRKVKMVDITGGSTDGALGYIYGSLDPDTAPSWFIRSFSVQNLYCAGKDTRTFKVLKCENGELILQEGDMTYFFKQFN